MKQGGIISPLLFNFFIDDLIRQCCNLNIGARIGKVNVSIIAYADDLVLISPIKKHLDLLLGICGNFAEKWKIEFNPKKSLSYSTDVHAKDNFILNGVILDQKADFVYLGLTVGSTKIVGNFWIEKFRDVEKALYSLNCIGFFST